MRGLDDYSSLMRSVNYNKSQITTIQIDLSKQHMKFKQEMEGIVKDFKEFLRETPHRIEETPQKIVVNHQQVVQQQMRKVSKLDELFQPTRDISRKPTKKRPQTQDKKKTSLAQQMLSWYELGKQQKNMLPQDLRDQVQNLHQDRLNQSLTATPQRRKQFRDTSIKISNNRNRHLMLKQLMDSHLEVEIVNE